MQVAISLNVSKTNIRSGIVFSVLYNEAVIAFFVINICITSHPDGNCIARYFTEKTWINRFGGISLKNSLFWNSNLFGKQGSGVFRPPASFASKSGWNWFSTLSIVIYLFIYFGFQTLSIHFWQIFSKFTEFHSNSKICLHFFWISLQNEYENFGFRETAAML